MGLGRLRPISRNDGFWRPAASGPLPDCLLPIRKASKPDQVDGVSGCRLGEAIAAAGNLPSTVHLGRSIDHTADVVLDLISPLDRLDSEVSRLELVSGEFVVQCLSWNVQAALNFGDASTGSSHCIFEKRSLEVCDQFVEACSFGARRCRLC